MFCQQPETSGQAVTAVKSENTSQKMNWFLGDGIYR